MITCHKVFVYLISLVCSSGVSEGFLISKKEPPLFKFEFRQSTEPQEGDFDWASLSGPRQGNANTDLTEIEDEHNDAFIEDNLGNVQIPPGGFSVSDDLDADQNDRFETILVPVKAAKGVAQLVTSPVMSAGFEPVRYLIALSPPQSSSNDEDGGIQDALSFCLIDVPPYSTKLETDMKKFMGEESSLAAIMITSRDSIHYDNAAAVYTTRRSDLDLWARAFPGLEIVSYRLDTPRDCRAAVTQCLDGYGPFYAEEEEGRLLFKESGRPLTYAEWDSDVAQNVLSGKLPPDDNEGEIEDEDMYSDEAIRKKEDGKQCLVVCTPGHSFGSLSFVFPETKVCCSGYTIPVEDTRYESNLGISGAGPSLDCRGYITTSKAGIAKQMESARKLIHKYVDRFEVVLPARGDPIFLEEDVASRRKLLLDIVTQYDQIGKAYEQLGIIGHDDDGDEA